jgi:hypothetical protein
MTATTIRTAASHADTIARLAQYISDAGLDVSSMSSSATKGGMTIAHVQLTTEADVDRVADMFGDADVDSGASNNYSRTASLGGVTVRIFSGRTDVRHRAGRVESSNSDWAEERVS